MKRTVLFMTRMLASLVMSVVALVATADEYIDPQTNVIYTYEPGQTTASVKAGREEVIDRGYGYEKEIIYFPGSPNASGDVMILDRFTVGTEEYVVTSIGKRAFYENLTIKSISIPNTVTDIGDYAFHDCDNLVAVQLPEGLTQIAYCLFLSCDKLMSVVIPPSVCRIEMRAFAGCSSLASITLPASLTFAGKGAFDNTPWYASMYDKAPEGPFYLGPLLLGYKGDKPTGELVIKEGTTCVGNEAFLNCNGLTSITVPQSVACVDYEAFHNCTSLTAVHITNLEAWCGIEFKNEGGSKSSNPLFYAHHLYLDGKEVTDLVIPEGVTSIGNFAFDYFTDLTSVTIPDGVTNIGACAFRGCENLTNVIIPPSVTTIGDFAFIWCKKMDTVHISDLAVWCGISFFGTGNPLYYGAHLYLNDKEVTDLTIPDGITNIGNGAFFGCSYLSNVTIPEGVISIGEQTFRNCSGLTSISLPTSLSSIGLRAFQNCGSLASIIIPEGVTSIGEGSFWNCSSLTTVTIPATVKSIDSRAFFGCRDLESVISWIEEPFEIMDDVFELYDEETNSLSMTSATLYVPKGCKVRYESTAGWSRFANIKEINGTGIIPQNEYRPFIEDDKVWKVGTIDSGNPVRRVEYYYFDGDTIIGGKTCKQMMRQRYVSPDYPDYDIMMQYPLLSYVGAWYEEDKKVYVYDGANKVFRMMYDFSLDDNGTFVIDGNDPPYIVGPRQTGGIKGFKGVYRNVMRGEPAGYNTTWLEGLGSIEGPIFNVYYGKESHGGAFLMSCTVGDEVIYLNDEYEDGATPDAARKKRIDFTHTTKIKPKARIKQEKSDADLSIYGEYNEQLLGINLNPIDDAYQVRIADETGKAVYEKDINAATIVGLNIDISAYAAGRYTITVENNDESFTGEFDTETTGISDASRLNKNEERINNESIYDLQGRRIHGKPVRKGVYIRGGKMIMIK